MLTVYLDTCFYLGLGAATPEVADQVIERLTSLDVRPAISLRLVQELTGRDGPHDAVMVGRIRRLPCALSLEYGLTWEDLAGPRDAVEAVWRARSETMVEGLSALARRGPSAEQADMAARMIGIEVPTNPEDALALTSSLMSGEFDLRPSFLSLGIDPGELGFADGPISLRRFAEYVERSSGIAADTILAHYGFGEAPQRHSEMSDHADRMREHLNARFPQEMEDRRAQEALIDHRVARSTSLPDVALGRGSRSANSKIAGYAKDADHVATVSRHRDRIDFFQVDWSRFKQLQADPDDPIHELGLADICFAGADVEAMVDALIALVAQRGEGPGVGRG